MIHNAKNITHNFIWFLAGIVPFFQARSVNIFVGLCFVGSFLQLYKQKQIRATLIDTIKLADIALLRKHFIELLLLGIFAIFQSPDMIFSAKSLISVVCTFYIGILALKYNYTASKVNFFILGFAIATCLCAVYYLFGGTSFLSGKSLVIALVWFWLSLRFTIDKPGNKTKRTILLAALYIALGVIVFKNSSATAKVAYFLSPLVYAIFTKMSIKTAQIILMSFILSVSIAIPVAVYNMEVQSIFQKYPAIPPSFKHRMCILKYSMEKIKENPLSGNGFRASRLYENNETCFAMTQDEVREHIKHHTGKDSKSPSEQIVPYNAGFHPHNFIIQILFEFGVFGVVLLFAISAKIIGSINPNINKYPFASALSITSVFFVMYIFSYSLWEGWAINTIFIALLLCNSKKSLAFNKISQP